MRSFLAQQDSGVGLKRNSLRALVDHAYEDLKEADYERAAHHAEELYSRAPDDVEPFLLQAEISQDQGRFSESLAFVDEGLKIHPRHAGLNLKKATLLIDYFEEIDEAFAILQKLADRFAQKTPAELKTEHSLDLVLDIYLLLIDCYRLKSDYLSAFEVASRAKRIAPSEEAAILAMATAHFEVGEYLKSMALIEPVEGRQEIADFYWLLAHIYCAQGRFEESDQAFLSASKIDKSRYHRPVRLDAKEFQICYGQALATLPREIREYVQNSRVQIEDIVPVELVKEPTHQTAPQACIVSAPDGALGSNRLITVFQKNVENMALNKSEIKDIISSAMIHELSAHFAQSDS